MVIRINPARQTIWPDKDTLQIGYGRNAVSLGKLTPAQERLVAALYIGVADNQLDLIASQTGNSPDNTKQLLDELSSVIVRDRDRTARLSAEEINQYFSDIMRANLIWNEVGEQIIAARKNRHVFVENFSASSVPIVLGLAASGIGTICSSDFDLVHRNDVIPGGYTESLVGKPRSQALQMLLAACNSQAKTTSVVFSAVAKSIDFGVLISNRTISPHSYQPLLASDVPHLAVVFDEDGAWISQLIDPGKTPCLSCLHVAKNKAEAEYLSVATQLTFASKKLDDAARRLFTAGLAVEKTLRCIDSPPSFELKDESRAGYRLANDGTVETFGWSFEELCSCRIDSVGD